MSEFIKNVELRPFEGFYDSIYESSDNDFYNIRDEVEYYNRDVFEEDIVTESDLDIDYKARRKDIVDSFIIAWKSHAPACVIGVSNPELDSPKYYNYRTDEVYADVELSDSWIEDIKTFIKDNYDSLKQDINKDWSSRDGFFSYISNDVDEWDKYLFEDKDARYISIMLTYMMMYANPDLRDDIIQDTLDDIYEPDYIIIVNPDIQKKLDALRNNQ